MHYALQSVKGRRYHTPRSYRFQGFPPRGMPTAKFSSRAFRPQDHGTVLRKTPRAQCRRLQARQPTPRVAQAAPA
ncbi:MAG: hypothetical protein PUP91_34155 [Rhizonema sp. PD37]|nr:hypothetical protein [Rhizonema sp. PD37]